MQNEGLGLKAVIPDYLQESANCLNQQEDDEKQGKIVRLVLNRPAKAHHIGRYLLINGSFFTKEFNPY